MSQSLADLAFSDLYVRLDGSDTPMYRPKELGAASKNNLLLPLEYIPAAERFGTAVRAELKDRKDGTLEFEGIRCRLDQQQMADGSIWVCAHRINADLPEINKLGFAPHICTHLQSLGEREGLILISGSAGHGKTTTGVALLLDYLKTFGGTAVALEDPVEYISRGRHGDFGQCFQIEIQNDEGWAESLKHSLRWSPRYIFVGEVRTPRAAEQLLHAATTGHTVITTFHGGMPEEALTGLLFLAEQVMGPGAGSILAGCLTALVHQTLRDDGPFVRYLFTEENAPSDPIRSLIREGKIGMLSTYIDRIAARLANQPAGMPPMAPPTGPLPPLPPIRR